jgi:phosphoribosylamine--glycine ligase
MRVLVLGSGGREHALAWALARGGSNDVLCAPGSDGIALDVRVAPADLADPDGVIGLARTERVDLVVIGPEVPLVDGLADGLEAAGVPALGPGRQAARLEGSKVFAKEFMDRHGVPTAPYRVFDDPDAAAGYATARGGPIVVKADGLAAGKGVFVCDGPGPACAAIDEIMREHRFGESGRRVVLEDRLVGEEASYYVVSDGERFRVLATAQDHKRALDGDRGENTGGMGAYSPAPVVTPEVERRVLDRVVRPTLAGLADEGSPYRGVLFVGLMIEDGEPSVVEFNVRLGDPETQAILFRLESDLLPTLHAAAVGRLDENPKEALRFGDPAVCVVVASKGYPRSYPKGLMIEGLGALAEQPDVKVFHAGTRFESGTWRTSGGRVFGVTTRAATLEAARDRAYDAIGRLGFDGMHYRRDIAARALEREGKT